MIKYYYNGTAYHMTPAQQEHYACADAIDMIPLTPEWARAQGKAYAAAHSDPSAPFSADQIENDFVDTITQLPVDEIIKLTMKFRKGMFEGELDLALVGAMVAHPDYN